MAQVAPGEDGAVLATAPLCGQTISTSSQWKCQDWSSLTQQERASWSSVSFVDAEWPEAQVLGPNGIGPYGQIPNQAAYWVWGPADQIACRYVRYARPREYERFMSTQWTWSTRSTRECESWRCGLSDPVVSVASAFPRGSSLHMEGSDIHDGDYELDGLCYVKTDADLQRFMHTTLTYSLDGVGSTEAQQQATAFRPAGFNSAVYDWTIPAESTIPFSWNTGGTQSSGTGPSGSKTKAGTGYYLYAEALSGNPMQTMPIYALLDSPNVRIASISFWYNMYGATMGSLHFDVVVDGEAKLDIVDPIDGDQGQG